MLGEKLLVDFYIIFLKIYLGIAKSLNRFGYIWIGLNDRAQEGSFIWADETSGKVYTFYIFKT